MVEDNSPDDAAQEQGAERRVAELISRLAPDEFKLALRVEQRRSMVRVVVTYLVTGAYIGAAFLMMIALIRAGDLNAALAVLSSVAAAAGTIIGFWFGARGAGGSETARMMTAPLAPAAPAPKGEQSEESDPSSSRNKGRVAAVQRKLKLYSQRHSGSRHERALDAGPIDGVLGSATLAAINTFLGLCDPPDRFEDLEEPKLEKVEALLDAELSHQP